MLIEVKSNQKAYQKATKQLFDGKERLEEVFSVLGMTTAWQYIGVFFALEGDGTPLFDCEKCSTYGIIGEESITEDLETIEKELAKISYQCTSFNQPLSYGCMACDGQK